MNSLSDPGVIAFIFGPAAMTAIVLATQLWVGMRSLPGTDAPSRFLMCVVRWMPASRREWSDAMIAELEHWDGAVERWRHAIGCARVALFPPRAERDTRTLQATWDGSRPICGVLAVTVPSLGLPLIYLAAVVVELMSGRSGVATSELFPPGLLVAVRMAAVSMMVGGVPLGLIGLMRGERVRSLLLTGPLLSIATFGYFFVVMTLVAGGPGAD